MSILRQNPYGGDALTIRSVIREDDPPKLGRSFLDFAALDGLDRSVQPRSLTSFRHSYATNQIVNNRIDLYLLSSNMGTSIQMIERHYGHLEPVQRASELAGRGKHLKSRKKSPSK